MIVGVNLGKRRTSALGAMNLPTQPYAPGYLTKVGAFSDVVSVNPGSPTQPISTSGYTSGTTQGFNEGFTTGPTDSNGNPLTTPPTQIPSAYGAFYIPRWVVPGAIGLIIGLLL